MLQQYYECNVTEPKLLAQLHAFGIKMSLAALSNLLTEGKAAFHAEKQGILAAGLSCATALTVDDTGARHQGRNGHTTHIGNQYFAFFETTESKSRLNFLRILLLGGVFGYRVTDAAVAYWQDHGLPQALIDPLLEAPAKAFADDQNWQGHLTALGITGAHHQQCATEGALWGAIVEQRLLEGVVVVSDGAPQFAIGDHARCWIHAERQVQQVACATPEQHRLVERTRDRIWKLYRALKQYAKAGRIDAAASRRLRARFDRIFNAGTTALPRSTPFSTRCSPSRANSCACSIAPTSRSTPTTPKATSASASKSAKSAAAPVATRGAAASTPSSRLPRPCANTP